MRRVLVAACLLTAFAAAGLIAVPRSLATSPSVIDCARAESQRNFGEIRDYRCHLVSYRTVWKMNGELDRDNVLRKIVYFRTPNQRKEVFVSGTLNGSPATRNDFLFERFGLDASTSFADIECLSREAGRRFELSAAEDALLDGRRRRVIRFRSTAPGETRLQDGRLLLPVESCAVARLEASMVQRFIVENRVEVQAVFELVSEGVWLPTSIDVRGVASIPLMQRRFHSRNLLTDYRVNAGLDDSVFD